MGAEIGDLLATSSGSFLAPKAEFGPEQSQATTDSSRARQEHQRGGPSVRRQTYVLSHLRVGMCDQITDYLNSRINKSQSMTVAISTPVQLIYRCSRPS